MNDFNVFIEAWKIRASRLLDSGLEYLQQLEYIPAPDGVFGNFLDQLIELPFTEKHVTGIVALINKQSPYLQECGIKLAIAFLRDVGEDPALGVAIGKLLGTHTLDPWVLQAIVEFAQSSSESIDDPDNILLFKGLAQAVYEREYKQTEPFSGNIMRSCPILHIAIADARKLLEQVVLTNTHPARTKAVLPYLEQRYNTKGLEDTVNTIRSKLFGI